MLTVNCIHNRVIQLVVSFVSRELRILSLDGICALEQESCFTCLDHTQVVVAVTAGNGVVADGQRILKSVISPFSPTTSVLQKMVG